MQSPSHSSMTILPRLEALMDAGSVFLPCAFSPYRCRDGDFSECGLFTVGIRWWLLIWLDQLGSSRIERLRLLAPEQLFVFVPPHGCGSGMAGDTKSLLWLLLLRSSSLCFASDLDIMCLMSIRNSVSDPRGELKSSWNFSNGTNGFLCKFTGVECWNPNENRVLSLRLGNLGLEGSFPQGLQNCSSMSGLDLSSNNLSGPIPPDISRQMPYMTSLDLSYNSFSGEIPSDISNMQYLGLLNLQHNQLSGQIPEQFALLTRLTTFSVADNLLSGTIPSSLRNFLASNFVGNKELCGSPLDECSDSRKENGGISGESSIGAAVGFILGFVVALYFSRWFIFSKRLRAYVLHI